MVFDCRAADPERYHRLKQFQRWVAGKGVTADAAELFLSWLEMEAPCLGLDLTALGVEKAKQK